jgi:hypothetical protein
MIKEALKNSFRICKELPSIFSVFIFFSIGAGLLNKYYFPDPAQMQINSMALPMGLSFLIIFLYIYLHAGVLGSVRDKIKEGRTSFSNFLHLGIKYFLSLLFFYTSLLLFLIATNCALIFLLYTLFPNVSQSIFSVILITILTIWNCVIILFAAYVPSIAVADNTSIIKAIKISFKTTCTHLGTTVGILFLYLLALSISTLIAFFSKNYELTLPSIFLSSFLGVTIEIFFSALWMYVYLEFSQEKNRANF